MKTQAYYDVVDSAGKLCVSSASDTLNGARKEAEACDSDSMYYYKCQIKSHKRPHKVAVYEVVRFEEYPVKAKKPTKVAKKGATR